MSQVWQQTNGVQNLQRKNKQPYYHMLVSDGSYIYAPEENLEPLNQPGTRVTHGQVSYPPFLWRPEKIIRQNLNIFFRLANTSQSSRVNFTP